MYTMCVRVRRPAGSAMQPARYGMHMDPHTSPALTNARIKGDIEYFELPLIPLEIRGCCRLSVEPVVDQPGYSLPAKVSKEK